MKRIPPALIIGIAILTLIALMMAFPQLFTDKNPYDRQRVTSSIIDGRLVFKAAPHSPSKDFLLGSDDMGRDIYSYIVYGTRLTIILGTLIALGRFLLAAPVAMAAGSGNTFARAALKQFNILFSAIPALLIGVIILRLDFFLSLEKSASLLAFVLTLSAVGWPKLGGLLAERVEDIYHQPFITSEIAIGKRRSKILRENILPHLAPEMVVLFFMEIARALTILMQLGIFSVFLGNLKLIADTEGGVSFFNISFEPEWASMLSTSRSLITIAPWAVIFPALAFFLSVLGFNLFGEGLRRIMQQKNTQIIPAFRKLITGAWAELWKASSLPAKLRTTGVAAAVILLIIIPPAMAHEKKFAQPVHPAPHDLPAEQSTLPDTVVFGTDAAAETARHIAGIMQQLGLKPLFDKSSPTDGNGNGDGNGNALIENYMRTYETGNGCRISDYAFSVKTGKTSVQLTLDKDFTFTAADNISLSGRVYDAAREDLFTLDDYAKFDGKFVLIDRQFYTDAAVTYFMEEISGKSKALGFLLTTRDQALQPNPIVNHGTGYVAAALSRELTDQLRQNPEAVVTVSATVEQLGRTGYNIAGIYPGTDRFIGDEAVVVGMGYNYLESEGEEVLAFNLELMRRLSALQKTQRSIIFLFFDGTPSPRHTGIFDIADDFPYDPVKVQLFLNLTGIHRASFNQLEFSSAQAPFTRQFAWSLAHTLEQDLAKSRIPIRELETRFIDSEYYFTRNPADNAMFWGPGLATIILAAPAQPVEDAEQGRNYSLWELGPILAEHIKTINY